MKRSGKRLLAGFIILSAFIAAHAQQTMIYKDPEATYRSAMELFNKEKYAIAREQFLRVADQITETNSPMRSRAEFFAAACGYELFNNNADIPFQEFLVQHDISTLQPLACLELGKLEYRKGEFRKAIQYFNKVDKYDLEDMFKIGYSYLKINDLKKAEVALGTIKDENSLYFGPATYFLSHIAYTNHDYGKALDGLKKLVNDETFKNIVPYYLAQIYYMQEDYDNLLKVAPDLLKTANIRRGPEIARMIGEASYKNKKFAEAIPYLENYIEKTKTSVSRQDYYELGYAAYRAGQWDKAIENFNKAVNQSDTLSQNAFYHLGDCYLRTGQKKFALNAFQTAYKEGFDFTIKEDALFNYAKLSYELSYDPYNEAINALKLYIKEYPDSKRVEEANTYLVNLFMSTSNYKDALTTLENIKNKDLKLKEAWQKLNYYRGIEEFNDGKFTDATRYFTISSEPSYDKSIQAASVFWIAECWYRQGNFDKAIEFYKQYQVTPGAFALPYYYLTDYNIGYSYFKQKEYDNAIVAFRKLFAGKEKIEPKTLNDAYLRAGDCYFITKNYEDAIEYYDLAAKMNKTDGDYALYQKSLAQGATGKPAAKAATLEEMIRKFPKSSWQAQARYEQGISYLTARENKKALDAFESLIKYYPSSRFVKDATLRTGLIYYNEDKDEMALATFKKVVADYPATPESKDALMSIRNIYVDQNKVDDFFIYAKNLPFSNVTGAAQDSITYLAAENQYMSKDCNSASQGLKNYIEKFPQGIFRLQAHAYLADCQFRSNQPEEALKSYQYVINEPQSKFTETALLNASAIYFSKKDYEKALAAYKQLLQSAEFSTSMLISQTGIMRCNFLLKKYEETLESCQTLISNENATAELITEAHLTQAKAALLLNRIPLAQTEFEKTYKMAKNEMGAESKYNLASIQFSQENYKETEKMVFEFISEFPSYDYWLAKSFILLADVYVKMDNNVQAKQTLQSIIDNYEGADLVEVAHARLNAIIEAEKAGAKKKEEDDRKALEKEKEQESIKIEQQGIIDNK
ncbi:MAG: tetratricopeptide repeat protein [Bacteroidetes bacterium]|nr:tetratricopeptide repeat protein [Bacteroidota bacterium]